jgi:hypothetical protein
MLNNIWLLESKFPITSPVIINITEIYYEHIKSHQFVRSPLWNRIGGVMFNVALAWWLILQDLSMQSHC